MIDVNRLTHAADTLRDMATSPANHNAPKLLILADELNQIHNELPSFVAFTHTVLSKYTSPRRA